MSTFDYYRKQAQKRIKRTGGIRAAAQDWKKEWLEPHPQKGSDGMPANAQKLEKDSPAGGDSSDVPAGKPSNIVQTESGFSFKAPTAKQVCFGFEVDKVGRQRPVYMDVQNHTFVVGITGGGKSVTMNAIIAQLADIGPDKPGDLNFDDTPYQGAYCAIVGVDLKGGIELSFWQPRLSFLATTLNEVDFLLDRLHEENERRQKHLRAIGAKKIIPSKNWPLIIVLMDELAEATASGIKAPGKNEEIVDYNIPLGDKSRQDKLRRLSATSRSQGIFFLCATQRPSADLVPTGFRSNFGQVLCHRVKSATDVDVCMGPGSSSSYPAHQLPADVPGMMYAQVASRSDVPICRAFYIEEEKTKEIAERNRHKRYNLPWLFMPKSLYAGSVMQEYAQREKAREEEEAAKRQTEAEGQNEPEEQAAAQDSPEGDFSTDWPEDFEDPEQPLDEETEWRIDNGYCSNGGDDSLYGNVEAEVVQDDEDDDVDDDLQTDFEPLDDQSAAPKIVDNMSEALKLFSSSSLDSSDLFDAVDVSAIRQPQASASDSVPSDLPELDIGDLIAAGASVVEEAQLEPTDKPADSTPVIVNPLDLLASRRLAPHRSAMTPEEEFFSDDPEVGTLMPLPPASKPEPIALPARSDDSDGEDDEIPSYEVESTVVQPTDFEPFSQPSYSPPESGDEEDLEDEEDAAYEVVDSRPIFDGDADPDDIFIPEDLLSDLFDVDLANAGLGDFETIDEPDFDYEEAESETDDDPETITPADAGFAEIPTLDGEEVGDDEDEDSEWEIIEPLSEVPF